tara:strand:- start:1882 stop:2148 length:267 start_codon:yes stop_codon:yes gene_type:complete
MEDKLDLILLKIKTLERKIDDITKTVEAHRVEHGFEKMQDGGINRNFGGSPSGMPGSGGGMMPPGMGAGYQMPGQGMPMQDPSRPPGM